MFTNIMKNKIIKYQVVTSIPEIIKQHYSLALSSMPSIPEGKRTKTIFNHWLYHLCQLL